MEYGSGKNLTGKASATDTSVQTGQEQTQIWQRCELEQLDQLLHP